MPAATLFSEHAVPIMSMQAMNVPNTTSFFAGQSVRSLTSARAVLGELFDRFRPQSVLDVGCGVAPWLCAAQELGAADILGVDGDYVDRAALLIDPAAFLPVDLERQRLCDVAPLSDGRRFDLVISVEVAQHLSFSRAESFVNDLTQFADVVLFSAAVPFQGGEHHVNEQWPEFWALLFRAHGFDCLDLVRPLIWARADVDWWYAQNLLLFVCRGSSAAERLKPPSLPQIPPLSLVHPSNYLAQMLNWFHTHRMAAAEDEEADLAALVVAYQAGSACIPPLRTISRAEAAPGRPDVFPNTRVERCFPETLLRERQIQYEILSTAHASLRDSYLTQQAEMRELRREMEDRLVESRDLFVRIVAETEGHLAETGRHLAETERRLAEMERSRVARLARAYYALYSRSLLGLPLRLLRRTVGGTMRRLRPSVD
ncbi:class I SAM-dependent methyltransferase [Acidisphaera sp. S103]|uniref:class I SAM-dependent methyltransferase n=1 Tax=Acidisphaera sp. S103 TaxID=1747223 RepID=UPI00131B7802|nr:class I SAM-dependent methyltransferase [Acidisphaera sp. S103]